MIPDVKIQRWKWVFLNETLGMTPADIKAFEEFIASRAKTVEKGKEEVSNMLKAMGSEDGEVMKGLNVFLRDSQGSQCFGNHQVVGYISESWKFLRALAGTECAKGKAYKDKINLSIRIDPVYIKIYSPGGYGRMSRRVEGSTPQGKTISIVTSETIGAGAWVEFDLCYLDTKDGDTKACIEECMSLGKWKGTMGWRGSGARGRFTAELISESTRPYAEMALRFEAPAG